MARKICENCDGLGHTDMGQTICPDCLDTGYTTPQLTALIAEHERAEAHASRAWKLFDDARHLEWTLQNGDGIAHNLEMHADEVDCGSDCEIGYTESDTNAHVCSLSDRGECPFDTACELRDVARALRAAQPVANERAARAAEAP